MALPNQPVNRKRKTSVKISSASQEKAKINFCPSEPPRTRTLTPDDIIDRENRIEKILRDIIREKRQQP